MQHFLAVRRFFRKHWHLTVLMALGLVFWTQYLTLPLTDYHSWRQADVAQVARNYYENGHNIFMPEINWTGDAPGYVETEFSLVPYLASFLYHPFGVQEWVARLIPIAFSLGSIYFLYSLVRVMFDRRTAFLSGLLFLLSPLNQTMGRAFMTEPAMVTFSIAAVYYAYRYLKKEQWKTLLLAALCWALAILVKAPTLYLGLVFLYLFWNQYGWKLIVRPRLYLFGLLAIVPGLVWYLYAHFHLFQTYGNSFIFWTGQNENNKFQMLHFLTDWPFYFTMLDRSVSTIFGPFLLGLGVIGATQAWIEPRLRVFVVWLVAIGMFILYGAHANLIHNYYQLPLVAPMAVLGGYVLAQLAGGIKWRRQRWLVVGSLMAFAFLWTTQSLYGAYRADMGIYFAGKVTEALSDEGELVITYHDLYNPALLYYTGRRGWPVMNHDIGSPGDIERWRDRGVTYLVSSRPYDMPSATRDYLFENYQALVDPRYFALFDLREPRTEHSEEDQISESPVAEWGEIALVSYQQDRAVQTGHGQCVERTFEFVSRGRMDTNYVLYMHYDRGEKAAFQQDFDYGFGSLPTTDWVAGETYALPIWLCNPPNIPGGEYGLEIGWYDPETEERLGEPFRLEERYQMKYYKVQRGHRWTY